MFKENGRQKRPEKKETAGRNKEFKCTVCGVFSKVSGTEFGEAVKCKKCGADMEEVQS